MICPPGGMILFSAAQLHATVPNTSGIGRYSVDFRTVHFDEVVAHQGARNLILRCTGTTMRDYLCCSDLEHLPDESDHLLRRRNRGRRRDVRSCFRQFRVAIVTDLVALVTGASSDIGAAISRGLADGGAHVLASGRDCDKLARIAAGRNGQIETVAADISSALGLEALRTPVLQRGRWMSSCWALEFTSDRQYLDALMRQLIANVHGPYSLLQILRPLLVSSKGLVVFVNSTQGRGAPVGRSVRGHTARYASACRQHACGGQFARSSRYHDFSWSHRHCAATGYLRDGATPLYPGAADPTEGCSQCRRKFGDASAYFGGNGNNDAAAASAVAGG